MALTRKFLKALGIDDEKIEEIITAHAESLEGIKMERDTLKADAEKLAGAQADVQSLTAQVEKLKAASGDVATVQAAFDAYKAQVEGEKLNATKSNALRTALKGSGVSREEFLNLLMNTVDLDTVEMQGDAIKNADAIITPMKSAYAGCFGTVDIGGTAPVNPPAGGNGAPITRDAISKMTPEEINKNWAAVSEALKH